VNLEKAMGLIREIPDFPKTGIKFQDITPLLSNADAFNLVITQMSSVASEFDHVAGMEARGFIFASAIANQCNRGFIPIRKSGKLPSETYSETYGLEYGDDTLEIHQDACGSGSTVLIVDDVLATGGTACAAIRLIEKTGAKVTHLVFLLEILALEGRNKINQDFPLLKIESIKAF
jgi:adenine phosphoribosyltransferase